MKSNIEKAEALMGRKMKNRFGSCFDSAAHQSIDFNNRDDMFGLVVCHGIAIANMPGQEGEQAAQAWLELTIKEGLLRAAYDPIWNILQTAKAYRAHLKIKDVVEYRYEVFIKKWIQRGFPGPWDEKIKSIADVATIDRISNEMESDAT